MNFFHCRQRADTCADEVTLVFLLSSVPRYSLQILWIFCMGSQGNNFLQLGERVCQVFSCKIPLFMECFSESQGVGKAGGGQECSVSDRGSTVHPALPWTKGCLLQGFTVESSRKGLLVFMVLWGNIRIQTIPVLFESQGKMLA